MRSSTILLPILASLVAFCAAAPVDPTSTATDVVLPQATEAATLDSRGWPWSKKPPPPPAYPDLWKEDFGDLNGPNPWKGTPYDPENPYWMPADPPPKKSWF